MVSRQSRRNLRRSRNAANRGGQNIRRLVHSVACGAVIRPRSDPNATVYQPWWPMTLNFQSDFDGSSTGLFTFKNLQNIFAQQLNVTTQLPQFATFIQFRIRDIRIWEITGAHAFAEFFALTDVAEGNYHKVRANADDEPGRNQWAKVGYIWPEVDQNLILDTGVNEEKNIFRASTETDGQFIVHMNILWRFSPPVPPTPSTEWQARKRTCPVDMLTASLPALGLDDPKDSPDWQPARPLAPQGSRARKGVEPTAHPSASGGAA